VNAVPTAASVLETCASRTRTRSVMWPSKTCARDRDIALPCQDDSYDRTCPLAARAVRVSLLWIHLTSGLSFVNVH
jgi:hypothetical protein